MQESFIPNVISVNSIILANSNKALDITSLVESFDFYENIYVNCITGVIQILDSIELPTTFPLIGEEFISFSLRLPASDDTKTLELKNFRVHKIFNREIRSNKLQSYSLMFSSQEFISNMEQRICKAWKGKTASIIVNDIFTSLNSSKKIEIEKTIGDFNYISTNVTPLQAINYIAGNRSINIEKLSDFAFFESIDQQSSVGTKFNFKSLSTLANQNPIVEFNYSPFNLKQQKSKVHPLNIENIEFFKGFDVLQNKANGIYNQTFVYYDMLRKKYVVQKNDYDTVFNETKDFKVDEKGNKIFITNTNTPSEFIKFVHVSEFPQRISSSKKFDNVTNKSIETKQKRSKNSYINSHTDKDDINSTLAEQTLYKRAVLLAEFEHNKLFLNDISGNYNYNIGKVITFKKPNIVNNYQPFIDNYGSEEDLFISGNYLITKNRHRITRMDGLNWSYRNYMEISKNTIKSDYNKV